MNRKIALILALPMALGLNTTWAQDADDEEVRYGLPGPAAEEARDASGVMDNENAQAGLEIAYEATMRVMDDAEAGRPDAVTANIPLPPGAQEDTEAVENAHETAGEGGIAAVEDAKTVAADQAQEALTRAQEAIEQRGRRGPPENLPTPPNVPEPPRP